MNERTAAAEQAARQLFSFSSSWSHGCAVGGTVGGHYIIILNTFLRGLHHIIIFGFCGGSARPLASRGASAVCRARQRPESGLRSSEPDRVPATLPPVGFWCIHCTRGHVRGPVDTACLYTSSVVHAQPRHTTPRNCAPPSSPLAPSRQACPYAAGVTLYSATGLLHGSGAGSGVTSLLPAAVRVSGRSRASRPAERAHAPSTS